MLFVTGPRPVGATAAASLLALLPFDLQQAEFQGTDRAVQAEGGRHGAGGCGEAEGPGALEDHGQRAGAVQGQGESTLVPELLRQQDVRLNGTSDFQTNRQIRLNELLKEHSDRAKLIVM